MMTPRERMIATLEHRMPDRVPIMLGWRDEVQEAVMRHYGVDTFGEVARILEADMSRGVGVQTRWPEYEKRVNGEISGAFGHIGRTVLHDERTFEDPWGVVERVGEDGKYLEWMNGPFYMTEDLDAFDWPTMDNLVFDLEDMKRRVAECKEQGYWVDGSSGIHPFKQGWRMRGFENFLADYVANPDWVAAIQERFLEYNLMLTRTCAEAGVDMFQYWGDVAMQHTMIVPPDSWRALDKVFWRRLIAGTREVNPDVRFFFHSDGDITPILPDLIEVGFDIVNPLQPECVNPGVVKRDFGDKITLDGGGSVQRMLPFGTPEDCRREVDFLMRHCAYEGGYIFRASNVVSFDCPVENVVAYYEAARDYDLSTIQGPPDRIDDPPCLAIGP